jgi:hypothetical protein
VSRRKGAGPDPAVTEVEARKASTDGSSSTPHPENSQAWCLHDGDARVPDEWPGMFRIGWPDGRVSDLVNFARARNAATIFAERGPPWRNCAPPPWKLNRRETPTEAVLMRLNGGAGPSWTKRVLDHTAIGQRNSATIDRRLRKPNADDERRALWDLRNALFDSAYSNGEATADLDACLRAIDRSYRRRGGRAMTVTLTGDYREYVLAEIRRAVLRARLMHNDLVATGIALKSGLIDPDRAIEFLADRHAVRLVAPESAVPS